MNRFLKTRTVPETSSAPLAEPRRHRRGSTIAKGPVGKETPKELRKEPAGELHDLAHQYEGLEVEPTGTRR
jgi:hypothetical protein